MRKLLFTILLTCCFVGVSIAQNIVDSFWSVKFGSDIATAKAIIKKTKKLSPVKESEDILIYKPGTFGGYNCNLVSLLFEDKKLTLASVQYPATKSSVFERYTVISAAIYKKYGNPYKITEEYTPPYHKGDGDEALAILAEHAKLETLWTSDPLSKSFITVEIEDDLSVVLSYWNKDPQNSKESKSEF
jgi:hypothetical protein